MDRTDNPSPASEALQAQERWRNRVLGWMFTAIVHLAALVGLLWSLTALPPPHVAPESILVSVVESPKPPGPPDAPESAAGSLPNEVQPVAPAAIMPVVRVAAAPTSGMSDLLSDSDLAGAARAGEGGGGGGCDIARRLQQALRRDPLVRAAVEGSNRQGRAILLWNGDWIQSGGQDGKGLSAVREAIMWDVAFSPEACRNERMHGLVVLTLADGTTSFALGSGEWRWSDLLFVRGTRMAR